MLYIVTIQDKEIYGEPDVAIAVVEAADAEAARRAAWPTIEQLADKGHGRCVPHARAIELGNFFIGSAPSSGCRAIQMPRRTAVAESIRSVVMTIEVDTNKQTYKRQLAWSEAESREQFEQRIVDAIENLTEVG